MDLVVKSPTTEGRFGFMFKSQPPLPASDTLLNSLGATMEEQPTANPASTVDQKDDNDAFNENPNPRLTSGFTFVGQFVDHDITFDTTKLSDQQSDPYATTNFRTPRYDLDAIYGLGPNQNPQFYDPNDRDKFLIVKRPYSQITGKLKQPDGVDETKTWDVKPDVVYDVPARQQPTAQGTHHRRPPQRPDADHPPAPRGHADVPQQAGGPHAHATGCRGRPCSSRPGAWPGGTTSGS